MDSRTQQLLGYPQEPTVAQQTALSQLVEIGTELDQRLGRIAQTPNVDRQWLQIGQQQIKQGLMALRQAVVPSTQFQLTQENYGGGIGFTGTVPGSSAR